jgi:site-specific DNA recombinase
MNALTSRGIDEAKRVGIWIRVSTEDQARGESPEHHERRARAYAEAKGWIVQQVYHLEGVSGKAVMQHAEAQRMLEDIKAERIAGLIFSKLARLARNTKELLEFADFFRAHGADLISLQESIDTSTPAGRLFYTMIAAMAQWEREEISERVAVSIPIRAKLGKPLGGPAPYGYKWVNKEMKINPAEAPIRRLMYELFAEHKRYRTVARLINEAGHRTRRGKNFSAIEIFRCLIDPAAKGLRRANYSGRSSDGKCIIKPESQWVHVPVEPIVSEELWERCNAMIDDRKVGPRIAKKAVHLFAGVTWCICGQKMYVPSNTPKYVCKECRNKIPVVDLEGIFHEQLKSISLAPNEVAKYLHQADKTLAQKQEMLDLLTEEHQKITQSMDRTYELFLGKHLTADSFGSRYRPLEERQKQIDHELPRLQAEVDFLKISYLSKDEVLTNARNLYARWPQLAHEERRQITEALAQKIVVGKGEIDIELCYLPPSPSLPPQKMAKEIQNL